MNSRKALVRNWRLCIVLQMLIIGYLGNATVMVYYDENLHFSPEQIFQISAAVSLTTFVGTVPFGYLADHWGAKRIMVIGGVLKLLHSTLFAVSHSFAAMLVTAVITGLARSAVVDLCNAVMTFSLTTVKHEYLRDRFYARFQRDCMMWASGVAYGATVIAGSVLTWLGGVRLPVVVQPILELSFLIAACLLVQPPQPFAPGKRLPHKLIRMMFVDRRDIRSLILLSTSVEVASAMASVLTQARLKEVTYLPTWSYAAYYASWAALTAGGAYVLHKRFGTHDDRRDVRIWTVVVAASCSGYALAALIPGIWGVVLLLLGLSVKTACTWPLTRAFLRRALPGDRTTHNAELSMASLLMLLLSGAVALGFGTLVEATSLHVGLLVVAVLLAVCGGASLRMFAKSL